MTVDIRSSITSGIMAFVLMTGVYVMIHSDDSMWMHFAGGALLGVYVMLAERKS